MNLRCEKRHIAPLMDFHLSFNEVSMYWFTEICKKINRRQLKIFFQNCNISEHNIICFCDVITTADTIILRKQKRMSAMASVPAIISHFKVSRASKEANSLLKTHFAQPISFCFFVKYLLGILKKPKVRIWVLEDESNFSIGNATHRKLLDLIAITATCWWLD